MIQSTPSKKRSFAKAAATIAVTSGALAMSLGLPLDTVSAQAIEPQNCDLVVGSVQANNQLGLTISVTNAAAGQYNVVLYNQGPIGVRGLFDLSETTLSGSYDKVDVGYSGRRAVEEGASATFTAAISPGNVPPTLDNSTFCTGTVTLIDNPADGTFFQVRH